MFVAQEIATKREVAIKVCEKRHIQKEKKAQAIMREKKIMKILNDYPSPYFIKLWATFQDENRLCNIIIHVNHIFIDLSTDFVMNYAKNGELLPFINKNGSFDEECTRFYSAEILLALEHLHKLGIVHR